MSIVFGERAAVTGYRFELALIVIPLTLEGILSGQTTTPQELLNPKDSHTSFCPPMRLGHENPFRQLRGGNGAKIYGQVRQSSTNLMNHTLKLNGYVRSNAWPFVARLLAAVVAGSDSRLSAFSRRKETWS